jgi:ubiquinol-cytochrome c reductase cytochrome b subunit
MTKTASWFFFVFGVLAALGAIAQINPIWLFGPYNTNISSNTSQPDWYIGFLEGALRLTPRWETDFAGHTISWNVFIPGVVLVVAFFLIMGGYPVFERWATGDARYHQVLDRPRNMPARTGIGAAIIAMAVDLELAGADDVIAYKLSIPTEYLVWAFRAGFFVLPVVAFIATRHVCIALQRSDRRTLRQGAEFGIAAQQEGAAYTPVSRPVSDEERAVMETQRPEELYIPVPRHIIPLPTPRRAAAQLRARLNHFYVVSRLETPSAGPPLGADGQADSEGAAKPEGAEKGEDQVRGQSKARADGQADTDRGARADDRAPAHSREEREHVT